MSRPELTKRKIVHMMQAANAFEGAGFLVMSTKTASDPHLALVKFCRYGAGSHEYRDMAIERLRLTAQRLVRADRNGVNKVAKTNRGDTDVYFITALKSREGMPVAVVTVAARCKDKTDAIERLNAMRGAAAGG